MAIAVGEATPGETVNEEPVVVVERPGPDHVYCEIPEPLPAGAAPADDCDKVTVPPVHNAALEELTTPAVGLAYTTTLPTIGEVQPVVALTACTV